MRSVTCVRDRLLCTSIQESGVIRCKPPQDQKFQVRLANCIQTPIGHAPLANDRDDLADRRARAGADRVRIWYLTAVLRDDGGCTCILGIGRRRLIIKLRQPFIFLHSVDWAGRARFLDSGTREKLRFSAQHLAPRTSEAHPVGVQISLRGLRNTLKVGFHRVVNRHYGVLFNHSFVLPKVACVFHYRHVYNIILR